MPKWTCRKCHGDGMHWSDERQAMVICSCPAGESKREYLKMTPEERRKARRKRGREKKREKEQEPIPF